MKRTFIKGIILVSAFGSLSMYAESTPMKDAIAGNKWFASLGAGAQFPQVSSSMSINNGSGFPAPANIDIYTTHASASAALALAGGYRWMRETNWLPSYSLGLFYQHYFATNIGETITQYSLPEFKNYTYNWKISSDMVLAAGKANLYNYGRFSPFVTAGIGVASNHATGYQETALPSVTARTSPGFANKSNTNFTYNLGLGLDVQLCPQWNLSVAYLYQDLGSISSGAGNAAWSNTSLDLGSYRANQILISAQYTFG